MNATDAAFLSGVVVVGAALAVLVGLLILQRSIAEPTRARLREAARLLALAYVALFVAWFVVQVI
jgi:thiosulfate reductase cytochrome b subunit